ncbi:hypothetical protein [Polyangium aurulentum]|uniref:hypothetical protein n=1 Tax=Polyangium aurulentum TaxID=2567896 RepID=UPI0010ADC61F|nr:hypothetical protein [Polyangium aurulentum]UQA62494.1 hypothetical protein E8A73_019370 [Polyangium aurulentum]
MTPFRDPPRLELGPLAVGLGEATARAIARMPSGGRLIARERGVEATHARGAMGCTGLVLAAAVAFVAMSSGWVPTSHAEVGLVVLVVIGAGASLAAVMQTLDRAWLAKTRPGAAVGKAARRVARRIARLSAHAERRPDQFGVQRLSALRRALSAAADPEVAPWIPDDVRGRTELLLARAIAAHAGPRWALDPAARAEVRALLLRAASNLADPAPAEADLAAIDASTAPVAARGSSRHRKLRFRTVPPARIAPLPRLGSDADAEAELAEELGLERAAQAPRLTVVP